MSLKRFSGVILRRMGIPFSMQSGSRTQKMSGNAGRYCKMGAEYKAKFLKNSQRHDKKTFFLKTFKNNFKKWLTKPKMSGKIYHVPNGTYALVAQLDRVTDYESVGRGFESLPSHQKMP